MSVHQPPDRYSWTQKAAYDDALLLTGEQWRWEILRRNPKYQEDYGGALPRLKDPNKTASGVTVRGLIQADKAAEPWGLYSFRRPVRGLAKCSALLAAASRSVCAVRVCSRAEFG